VYAGSLGAEDTVEREGRRNVLQRRERRSRWLITDVVVAGRWSWQSLVVLVAQGRAGGRNGDGAGFLWRKKKEEETEEENLQAGFLASFGPNFLLYQAINSASIYRRCKRVILSAPG
jgi:hypothetical protein